jgi:DNA-binding XRE family transcriptional regulator
MINKATILQIEKGLARKTDKPRWQAAILLGDYCKSDPEIVWKLCVKWGSVRNADTRMAIATCVLEHLLEHHFDPYFSKTVRLVKQGNKQLGSTLRSCWQFNQTKRNTEKFNKFVKWFSKMAA